MFEAPLNAATCHSILVAETNGEPDLADLFARLDAHTERLR